MNAKYSYASVRVISTKWLLFADNQLSGQCRMEQIMLLSGLLLRTAIARSEKQHQKISFGWQHAACMDLLHRPTNPLDWSCITRVVVCRLVIKQTRLNSLFELLNY
jgi:hypothetical protein